MFKTNQYFEGKLVSIGLESVEGNLTIGVMSAVKIKQTKNNKTGIS